MKHAIIAIAFVWWVLAGICVAADSPATILCGHVKFSGTRYPPPALADRLRAATSNILETATTLVQAYPALDLITTPEYSLYYSESLTNYSISVTVTNTGQNYELVLGESHSELVRAITNIQAFAGRHNVYFLLGTVPELIRPSSAEYPHLPAQILSNTMLIIDPNGRIVDFDRKTSGSDWVLPNQTVGSAGGDEALLIMNSTTRVRTLTTRDYHALRYLPVICAEREYEPMLQVVSNACADMLVELAWEGDMNLEELASNYYANPGDTNYWQENFFNSTWRQPHTVTYKDIRTNGIHVMNDAGSGGIAAGVYFDRRRQHYLYITNRFTVVGFQEALPELTTTRGTPCQWIRRFYATNDFEAVDVQDSDGDGAATWQEYVVGTDPTNGQSVFRIVSAATYGAAHVVTWLAGTNVPASPFRVYRGTNLAGSGDWAWFTNIVPNGSGTNVCEDAASPLAPSVFYRVRIGD